MGCNVFQVVAGGGSGTGGHQGGFRGGVGFYVGEIAVPCRKVISKPLMIKIMTFLNCKKME
jgi:hypothetical protein